MQNAKCTVHNAGHKRIKNWRNGIVLAVAILIGGGALLLGVGQTASPARPSPTFVLRPDNSWAVHFRGVRGRRLSRIYDPAYSAEEALAVFRAEYGQREVLCIARRSFAICDLIDRPPGK